MYDLKRLGANIKYLRKSYGETQEELGAVLNVEKNTISNYENGKREPDEATLVAIARHFMVTVEELIHEDFSDLEKLTFDNTAFFRKIDRILPIISSDEAMCNEWFRKAYTAHTEIYDELKKISLDKIDKLDICLEGYLEAENDKNAKVESASNFISMTFLLLLMFKDTPSIVTNQPASLIQITKKDSNSRKILENADPNFEKDSKEILEVFADKEFQEKLDEYKYILKQSQKWSDLADYFLALQYVLNLVQNSLTSEFNRRVGVEMLNSLISVKNYYAARYILLNREANGLKSSQTVDDKL
ncbi:MAG: helix-turn-helix domain-containing protein [Oscillospiraceae bacterium]|nr:helix-turn-helix domain-containing protein [Oscillospiraceae bacterium]